MDTNYIIETKNLTKQYGSQKSVADLNIHVKRGRIYGLLGRNGAGKTTTMKMVLQHFSGYIASLSMRKLYDERGNVYYGVDEDIRERLQARLDVYKRQEQSYSECNFSQSCG